MEIVVRGPLGDLETHVVLGRPDAVVADLIQAMDPQADASEVVVDGRAVSGDLELDEAGLVDGSVVELVGPTSSDAPSRFSPDSDPELELAVVGGLHAGRARRLRDGTLTVGRRQQLDVTVTDPTVSLEHVRLSVCGDTFVVEELGSHNGTRIEGDPVRGETAVRAGDLIQLGALEAQIRPALHHDRPVGLDPTRMADDGLIGFNRPPRTALPEAANEVRVPDAPTAKKRNVAFSVATLIGPIVMGIVMVKLMGNIRFALFALMSPVMFIGNHIATRRRNTRESKISQRQFSADLATFEEALVVAVAAERSRLEALVPDPAEILRRATLPSTRLWERRWSDHDYLRLRVGRGPARWSPPVDRRRVAAHADMEAAVEAAAVVPRCPVELDLSGGSVVGLVGDREAALAVARSLVTQAAVLHGPADLAISVLTHGEYAADWDWAKWLPHTRSADGRGRYLSPDAETSRLLMDGLLASAAERDDVAQLALGGQAVIGPAMLVVVDDETLTAGRRAPTRAVLRGKVGPVAGIVIASTADRLPAVCDTVVHLRDDLGDAEFVQPGAGTRLDHVVATGIPEQTARGCARALARYEDPEVEAPGAGIPALVRLPALLDLADVDADDICARWAQAGRDPAPRTPIGVGDEGVIELDMVADGPHALVGGTTGSGKSEFLRSLVAGMAAGVSPEHLVFVLVDYKGGSAFDECARLPHTVGMVTDLDEHLGERALRSLEAELHHRERTLRAHGATDLADYLHAGAPGGPMPRLLVVVDEFATMAAELPDFMGALVGIAQRGRSLGVHMILATQRPSGAVNANIKANTNIRIALRMQDVGDSTDVIDNGDAARISRTNPGRAYVRLGPTDVVPVQTALSTSVSSPADAAPVSLYPFPFGPTVGAPVSETPSDAATGERTDLVRLVDACVDAFEQSGIDEPRRPWLDMLPGTVPLDGVLADAEPARGVPLGLADDPAAQCRKVAYWDPSGGHLAVTGAVGSGTTSGLVSMALAACTTRSPDELHLYAADFGGGGLTPLGQLPHAGAVVAANERERLVRLVRFLADEVVRRRDLDAAGRDREPQIVVLVDGLAALLAEFDGLDGQEAIDQLKRAVAEGAGVGVAFAFTADRPMAIPMRMASTVTTKVLLRHADPGDFASVGLRPRDLPRFVPGRGVDGESGLVVQLAHASEVDAAVDAVSGLHPTATNSPVPMEELPRALPAAAVENHLVAGEAVTLPVGVAESDRAVRSLQLHPGEHVLVAGQPRSGVSTTLRHLARLLGTARPDAVLVAVAGDRSPLRRDDHLFDALGTVDQLAKVFELAAIDVGRQWVVVVDDAHAIDEPQGLEQLLKATHCHLVVGGRSEQLHGQFSHWTRGVRRTGAGLLLQPRLDADGDLLGVRLPRRLAVPLVPGRGFLVAAGECTLVQVAGADLAA